MANLLTITKEANDYFTFVLNGDTANAIKNTRNDLLTIGDFCHIKTSEGANLVKEQNIIYSNITIIDGVDTEVPVSVDDLFAKLISVGYWDWLNGSGGGGVDRFDDLLDTFKYFGKDGQAVRVNESEQKLETFVMPDVSYLDYFPSPLEALKAIRVKEDNSGYEFYEPTNIVVQTITAGDTANAPSSDIVYQALQALQAQISGGLADQIDLEANGVDDFVDIGTTNKVKAFFYGSVLQEKTMWTQVGSVINFAFIPDAGSGTKNLQFI